MVTKTVYKQIRGFVIIWLAITIVMGTATFLAVYFNYDPANPDGDAGNPLPLGTEVETAEATEALIVLPSASPQPTFTPAPTTAVPTLALVEPVPTDIPPPTDIPTPTPAPTPFPVEVMNYEIGIQVQESLDLNPVNQDNWYRSVAQDLDLHWVKQQVRWDSIEKAPGQFNWTVLDFVMTSARNFDINMMLSILSAPDWAREPEAILELHGPPADPQTFADFTAAILNRYPGQVQAIEVWNEQNIDREWTSAQGLSAANYVALLRATHETVKAIDPGIIIISGAPSPTGINDGLSAVDDFNYMDQLIDAGMLDWADCVGAHHNGYNVSPDHRYNEIPDDPTAFFRGPFDNPHHSWSFRSTLEGYVNRIRAAGRNTLLCVTEFGWPSSEDLGAARQGFEFSLDNTLAEQAAWIPLAMSNMEEWGFVWLAFIWNFNFGPQAGYAISNDNVPYSLIGPDFVFRPAYKAIKDWQREFRARTGR